MRLIRRRSHIDINLQFERARSNVGWKFVVDDETQSLSLNLLSRSGVCQLIFAIKGNVKLAVPATRKQAKKKQ